MQNNRTRSRKLLFQELYALKFNKLEKKSFYKSFYENKFTFKLDKNYIEEVVDIIKVQEKNFEKIIIKFAPKFKIESMSLIYILPIYIALSEMFFLKEEIPLKVSINEAIDLAKAYGDDSSKKIVNGILNTILENVDEIKKELKAN